MFCNLTVSWMSLTRDISWSHLLKTSMKKTRKWQEEWKYMFYDRRLLWGELMAMYVFLCNFCLFKHHTYICSHFIHSFVVKGYFERHFLYEVFNYHRIVIAFCPYTNVAHEQYSMVIFHAFVWVFCLVDCTLPEGTIWVLLGIITAESSRVCGIQSVGTAKYLLRLSIIRRNKEICN